MRMSELTAPASTKTVDIQWTLMVNDVRFMDDLCELLIKTTKMKQSGKPIRVAFEPVPNSDLCPVSAIRAYTAERPRGFGPLFVHLDKTPLTRYQFTMVFQQALEFARVPRVHL